MTAPDVGRLGYAARADVTSRASEAVAASIPRAGREHPPRCSFAQEQFWFVDRLTPGSTAYSFSWPVRLHGPLDAPALARALAEIVGRHEALRTRFATESGQPVQLVSDADGFALDIVDLSGASESERVARHLVDEETQRPFDLEAGELFRARLFRLSGSDHLLQIAVHHIVFDERSKVVLYAELGRLYEVFAKQGRSPLPEPVTQYADFAEWQRSWLTENVLREQLEYWAHELDGIPGALEFPSDRPRPAVASLRGARRRLPLPAPLTSALEELARSEGATFFAGLLAAFDVLLHRYTGAEDIVVGIPVDGRTRPELDDAIGVFLNTVVVRSNLAESPSFRQLLRQVKLRLTGAAAHADLPFERLVRELHPARDLSRHPIFQVLLAVNPPDPRLRLPGIEAEEVETVTAAAKVDLFLFLQERVEGFDALWEYSTDLFEGTTIDRIHAHLVRLLEGAVADPDRPIDELPLLSEDERRQLLVEWNGTAAAYPQVPLHTMVEAQVERSPDAIAVIFGEERLTYGELDARANQLARRLRAVGVRSESLVAIGLERSLDLVVAALAVLKAGGAYVPLDPELPEERLAFMLDDSQSRVLLTRSDVLGPLPGYRGTIVRLDAAWLGLAAESTQRLDVAVGPDDLAYVVYTSGSTGRPKGVLNTHGGVVNRLLAMQESYRLDETDRLLQKTPCSFDVAVRELFWPLLVGARLVVAAPGGHRDPSYLGELIAREQVTTVHFVPSMLQAFLERVDADRCRSLRCVLSGGEALTADLARRFFERFDCELYNFYGPTEAAISVTAWRCDARSARAVVPIGRPIPNCQLYVLDRRLELVPQGVWGELYIGGAQVARGYLDRADLTVERFVPSPFGPGRLYRTGDLGRWAPDGVLEFGGRIDAQVKLRGVRIEPGEIESVLAEHDAVTDCAVVLTASASGDAELAAYVVLREGSSSPGSARTELQSFLRTKLPEAMVPATVTVLGELPLSPSGKLDRAALPVPDRSDTEEEFLEPETPTERAIAAAWTELLGTRLVGRHDDFFALGGHSLLAARFLGRVSTDFRAELPLRALFEHPTLAAFARLVDEASVRESEQELPPLVARSGVRECSFAQERFWVVGQMTASSAAYNIPVPLRLRGDLRVYVLERALSEIVRRHEILRTRLSVQAGRPVQVIEPARPVTVDVIDVSADPDEERERAAKRLVDEITQTHFDPERGPLFGVRLVRLGDRDHVLSFVFDHLVFDGWSKVVLFRELGALYNAFADGNGSPLDEPGVQYGDFAEWQRSWLQGELLECELAYWTDALAGMPPALELPTDRPRPPIASMRGAWSRTTIPTASVERLQALARSEGATLYMALLGIFDILLSRYSGQDDIVVGMPVDSRDRPELDAAVGPFVDTVVVRVELPDEVTFRGLLERVRERSLDAIAHQRLPFERLVRELQPDRQLGRHPLYQVMLTLVPPPPPLELVDLEVEEATTERRSAPIDLTVFVEECADGLKSVWEYSTDLFEPATIDGMQAHFLRLLEAVVAEPGRPVAELTMLAETERRELLDAWMQPAVSYPSACLHELLEAKVAASPDAPAVTYEGRTLSYGELNERANRLAHRLRELDVKPETPVALCLNPSLDTVVAIVAVLKAGGAYVPLDPDYPAERLAFVLSDTNAPVLLTHEQLLPRLLAHEATVVCLDRDAQDLEQRSSTNPEPLARPEHLAYVIYTSGSTGQPKGVQVEHRQVTRLFTSTEAWFGFGPSDSWVLLHSYAFDFSVWELWGALLYGGRLVIAPPWTARSPQALARLAVDERVTVLNATPSLFVSAQDELLRVADTLALRFVVFGGEALQPSALRPWFERLGANGPTLVNMYGITETTVHVTYRPVTQADCERAVSPIGRPIPDLQTFVLDAQLEPVPGGVPGELFVGGAGVARGYLNRPELTAERFLANPFGPGRLYRTGDSVRHRADGELEFLGRLDDQVKIRGYRIELGEIEAAIADHEGVAESAVVAFEAAPGDTRLAAYVVPAADTAGAVQESLRSDLRASLAEKLPDFMVPSSLTLLDELPLTPNGKLDRRALPAPAWEEERRGTFVAPRTPTEERLAEIWRETLGLERVGVDDNFFHLGGHSLLAARVVTRARERFATDLSVRALFEHPTLAAFAEHVMNAGSEAGAGAPADEEEARDAARRRTYPVSFPQQQLFLIDELTPGVATYNGALAVRVVGELDADSLEGAVVDVVERHEALRTVLIRGADGPAQVVLDDWQLRLARVDLSSLPAEEREAELQRLSQEEARRPFDLGRDLMLRVTLFRLDAAEHVALFLANHTASDGWSVRVFCRDLGELYGARRANRPPRLPELPLQYHDFALWQRERLRGERLERERAYWRAQLAGAPTILQLPTHRPRPPVQTFNGASYQAALPRDVAADVLRLCREEDVTPYMLLLSVFGVLLYRLTGQDDILVGGPFANRSRVEFDELVGFFANTVAMRIRLAGNPPFTTLLARIRETVLEALDHQELPFEHVVEAVSPRRDLGVNPLVQVNFRVRVDPPPTLELAGATTDTFPVEVGFAGFDLALELQVLEEGIATELVYNTDLFECDSIERLAWDFEGLLLQVLARPDARLLSLELPSEQSAATTGTSMRGSAIRRFRETIGSDGIASAP